MRIEAVVGQRIREEREWRGLTQDQLGQRLGDLLGRTWSRQAVSAAEQGNRDFTAAQLVAFARVLDTHVNRFFVPPLTVEQIELPSGYVLMRQELTPVSMPSLTVEVFETLLRSVGSVSKALTGAQEDVSEGIRAMEHLQQQLREVLETETVEERETASAGESER